MKFQDPEWGRGILDGYVTTQHADGLLGGTEQAKRAIVVNPVDFDSVRERIAAEFPEEAVEVHASMLVPEHKAYVFYPNATVSEAVSRKPLHIRGVDCQVPDEIDVEWICHECGSAFRDKMAEGLG